MDTEPVPGTFKTSVIRTVVPFVVGWVVTLLVSKGINVDDNLRTQLASAVTVLVGSAYYIVIRLLEKAKPKVGVLLGAAKPPTYDTTGVETALDDALATVEALQKEVVALNETVGTFRTAAAKAVAKKAPAKAPAKKAVAKKAAATKKATPKAGA